MALKPTKMLIQLRQMAPPTIQNNTALIITKEPAFQPRAFRILNVITPNLALPNSNLKKLRKQPPSSSACSSPVQGWPLAADSATRTAPACSWGCSPADYPPPPRVEEVGGCWARRSPPLGAPRT